MVENKENTKRGEKNLLLRSAGLVRTEGLVRPDIVNMRCIVFYMVALKGRIYWGRIQVHSGWKDGDVG